MLGRTATGPPAASRPTRQKRIRSDTLFSHGDKTPPGPAATAPGDTDRANETLIILKCRRPVHGFYFLAGAAAFCSLLNSCSHNKNYACGRGIAPAINVILESF